MKTCILHKQETHPESLSDDYGSRLVWSFDEDNIIVYTGEEIDAMRQVRAKLVEQHGIEESRVGLKFLAVASINCKLRVDETVSKMVKLLELMEELGVYGIDDDLWKPEAAHELKAFAPAGKDDNGCSVTWIRGINREVKVPKEEEQHHVQACIMQYLAAHSDPQTLRNGVTLVIDFSGRDGRVKRTKVGNEGLVHSFQQALPQRPQTILMCGASFAVRTVVNATIKLASMFVKKKILDRIRFVSVEDTKSRLSMESAPVHVGGMGGGIGNYEEWVKERLELLTTPEL